MGKILTVLLFLIGISFLGYFIFHWHAIAPTNTIPLPSPTSLANPASVNCTKKGGKLSIMKRNDGSEFGVCEFADDMACEEWALMRGECPDGGVKTLPTQTAAQKYCLWLGGKIESTQCLLPTRKTCSTTALFAGTCSE